MNIKKIIKSNSITAGIAYKAREKRTQKLMDKYSRDTIDSNKIFFYRSGGGYGDNPKAIAEYLHKNYPNIELVWGYVASNHLESFPEYVKPVLFQSEECFKEMSTASVWVCSTTLPFGTQKKESQLYIQTWHGDKFLKKIANDAAAEVEEYKKRTVNRKFCEEFICDYYVTGCDWFVPIASSALGYNGAFLRTGMPRNDCLINKDLEKIKVIKQKLGISDNCKILIYAPTFRDYMKSHDQIGSNIDLVKIVDELEKKDNTDWICLLRAHDGKLLTLNGNSINDKRFMDVTVYPDIADLLQISDMLISDYSSCAADFALTGKFVLMYQDDFETYTTKGRTLYISPDESPYFTAYNMEEALDIISNVDAEKAKNNCKEILEFYHSYENGNACIKVCDVIIKHIESLKRK